MKDAEVGRAVVRTPPFSAPTVLEKCRQVMGLTEKTPHSCCSAAHAFEKKMLAHLYCL